MKGYASTVFGRFSLPKYRNLPNDGSVINASYWRMQDVTYQVSALTSEVYFVVVNEYRIKYTRYTQHLNMAQGISEQVIREQLSS